jgi:autotransporter-associated beta strand protein
MKPKSTLRSFLAIAGSSLLVISSASALTYYWDGNNDTSLYGTAQGTWSGTTAGTLTGGWSTSNTGVTVVDGNSVTTGTGDTINFGTATASSLLSGVITVSGTVNSGNMTFGAGAGNITLSGGIINFVAAATITTNNGSSIPVTIGSDITGAATSLTKAGAGILILSGANTYTGKTSITGGFLSINSIQNAGSATANALGTPAAGATSIIDIANGARLRYTGTGHSSDRVINNTTTTNSTITIDASGASGTFALSGGVTTAATANSTTIVLSGTGTGSQSGSIATGGGTNATAVTKSSTGTWVLGGNNTYTGQTQIIGGGSLVLDYGTSGGAGDVSKFSDTTALNFNSGAGNLILRDGSHNEVVGSTTVGSGGGHATISREVGSTATINLGLITRNQSAGVTLSFAADNLATTTTLLQRGMLGGGITVGSNWAKTDGSGNIIALAAGDYTAMTNDSVLTSQATTNYQVAGSVSRAVGTVNSLRIVGDGDDQVLTITSGNLQPSLVGQGTVGNTGGILYAGGGNDNYTITGAGNIQGQNGNQELIINTFQGTLTLDMAVTTGSATAGLTKTGAGTLILTKANTYSGGTFVNQGVLRLRNNAAAGTTGQITVGNGAALELANGVSIAAPLVANKVLTITGTGVSSGGALRNIASNTSSYAGAITIGTGGARINSDADGVLTLSGGITTFYVADVTFGGAGNTTVETAAITGAGRLTKDGTGKLTLSATNTYTGATTVSAGTLFVTGALSNSAVTVEAAGTVGSNGAAGTLGNGLTIAAGGNLDLTGATLGANSTNILGLTGGPLTLGNLAFTDLIGWDYAGAADGTYELIDGSVTASFGSTAFLDTATAFDFMNGKAGYFTSSSNGLNAVIFTVPEPSSALLGAIGLLALLRRRRS